MKEINNYIDRCLIDEYANKSFSKGYSLNIDDVTEHDRATLLDLLMKDDTDVKDYVLHTMQKLIDQRLYEKEIEDRYDSGCVSKVDHINGEISWNQRPGTQY